VWGFISFFPASATVKAGDEVVVKINAGQVSDMYGYQFNLLYDKDAFKYNGGLTSSISDISTIFAKELDQYLRVGSTKIGDVEGFSGTRPDICEITLIAKRDGDLSLITINGVNIVKSDLSYVEGVTDWTNSSRVKV